MPDIPEQFVNRRYQIVTSGLTIYDSLTPESPLWFAAQELEQILQAALEGTSVYGLPLRTRSKAIKSTICRALGYPVPGSFRKTQPRFPAQNLDTYVQKSNNLQIWNEEISPSRRYALIRVDQNDVVTRVRVVTGEVLAKLDTTGTLTSKFQARFTPGPTSAELVSPTDTDNLTTACGYSGAAELCNPTAEPSSHKLMKISELFERIRPIIGERLRYLGADQERNRGAALHERIARALGYGGYMDNGQFPDIREQLLEVKLQTSPTIDLGLVSPDSPELVDVPPIGDRHVRHNDVRYCVVQARVEDEWIVITGYVLATGEAFFSRFRRFEGLVANRKLQIPLPANFFL